MSAASVRWTPNPVGSGNLKGTFYPVVGFEGGRNLNRPGVLFKRPVDLSGYKGIARLVPGANAAIYLLHSDDQQAKGNLFRMVVDGSYIVRLPLADEPFVRSQWIEDSAGGASRQKVTSIRRNPRHAVEAGVTWSLNQFVGVRFQYRYGSLPPLFEFVNHQVTVGLTVKAVR